METDDAARKEAAAKTLHDIIQPDQTRAELLSKYDQWAGQYDGDVGTVVYNPPKITAQEVVQLQKDRKDIRILDVAAGTGLLGQHLKELGFLNVDALDGSSGMLDQAKQKGLYRQYICAMLGNNQTSIPTDTYDLVVTCGSFTPAHLDHTCLQELIRITKPGGHVVISMRESYLRSHQLFRDNLEPTMQRLEEKQLWIRETRRLIPNYYNDYDGVVFIFKVTSQT